MLVDIFIPTSNRVDSLKKCLVSLHSQSYKNFEIILVGLNESEEIQLLLKEFSDLKMLYFIQFKRGLISAANEALERTKGEIFVRIDDDVTAEPYWLESIVTIFQNNPLVGGVTGPTTMSEAGVRSRDITKYLDNFIKSKNPLTKLFYNFYSNYLYEGKMFEPSTFLRSGLFTLGSNYPSAREKSRPLEVNNLEACNFAVRTMLLKEIGGFDFTFLKGLGDYHEADIAMKIKKLGYKLIFVPKAAVWHNVEQGEVPTVRPGTYYRIQNFIAFYFRHFEINTFDDLIRFSINLCFQNAYYIVTFIKTRNFSLLGSIPGTFVGFLRVLLTDEN